MQPCLLLGDADAFFQRAGIVRANLRADAIFERRYNLAARRIVLRVRGENQRHVQRQAQRIAFDLDIALLHDVEHADLNFSREVGQFIDGKEPAVCARKQPVMNRHFAR